MPGLAGPRCRITVDLRPSHGANIIARHRCHTDEKIVVCAHFDTKHATPGALDNAAGVAALLALVLNLDGIGLKDANNTIAFFACPESFVQDVMQVAARWPNIVVTEP